MWFFSFTSKLPPNHKVGQIESTEISLLYGNMPVVKKLTFFDKKSFGAGTVWCNSSRPHANRCTSQNCGGNTFFTIYTSHVANSPLLLLAKTHEEDYFVSSFSWFVVCFSYNVQLVPPEFSQHRTVHEKVVSHSSMLNPYFKMTSYNFQKNAA